MPVPKSRSKQATLVDEVAQFLVIDPEMVFLDAAPMSSQELIDPSIRRKNTLRIWTGDMDQYEKDRIRGLKHEVKEMAARVNTKIAMSDRHPLGNDGQSAFEERRRSARGKKWAERNPKRNEVTK